MSIHVEVAELPHGDMMPIEVTSFRFRDRAFKSRALVFTDGSTAHVENSPISTSTPEHLVYLDGHPDFERVDGSA